MITYVCDICNTVYNNSLDTENNRHNIPSNWARIEFKKDTLHLCGFCTNLFEEKLKELKEK